MVGEGVKSRDWGFGIGNWDNEKRKVISDM
jgi:hypothetical protein